MRYGTRFNMVSAKTGKKIRTVAIQRAIAMADPVPGGLACLTTKTKTAPQDAKRVNVNEEYEVAYWSKRLGTTPEKLRAAVNKVGVMVNDVEKEMNGK